MGVESEFLLLFSEVRESEIVGEFQSRAREWHDGGWCTVAVPADEILRDWWSWHHDDGAVPPDLVDVQLSLADARSYLGYLRIPPRVARPGLFPLCVRLPRNSPVAGSPSMRSFMAEILERHGGVCGLALTEGDGEQFWPEANWSTHPERLRMVLTSEGLARFQSGIRELSGGRGTFPNPGERVGIRVLLPADPQLDGMRAHLEQYPRDRNPLQRQGDHYLLEGLGLSLGHTRTRRADEKREPPGAEVLLEPTDPVTADLLKNSASLRAALTDLARRSRPLTGTLFGRPIGRMPGRFYR